MNDFKTHFKRQKPTLTEGSEHPRFAEVVPNCWVAFYDMHSESPGRILPPRTRRGRTMSSSSDGDETEALSDPCPTDMAIVLCVGILLQVCFDDDLDLVLL